MYPTLARLISYLFHPIFIVFYGLLLLMWLNPFAFGVSNMGDRAAITLMLMVLFQTVVVPGVGIVLLPKLGFAGSIEFKDKQERIVPYIITGIFYLWLYKNLSDVANTPLLFNQFVLGAIIGLFLLFFFNIFTKISAHAAGMGGLTTALVHTAFSWEGSSGTIDLPLGGSLSLSIQILLAVLLLLTGIVGAARLALNTHTPQDLYRGYVVGILAQLVAALWS